MSPFPAPAIGSCVRLYLAGRKEPLTVKIGLGALPHQDHAIRAWIPCEGARDQIRLPCARHHQHRTCWSLRGPLSGAPDPDVPAIWTDRTTERMLASMTPSGEPVVDNPAPSFVEFLLTGPVFDGLEEALPPRTPENEREVA